MLVPSEQPDQPLTRLRQRLALGGEHIALEEMAGESKAGEDIGPVRAAVRLRHRTPTRRLIDLRAENSLLERAFRS